MIGLRAVLAGERPAAAATEDASDAWPGAWISLRLVLRGVEATRFTWAVLERETNDVAFTSADAGASAVGPPPSVSGTPVQADVWVPFPARLGRYVVAVSLLPEAGQRLDEYVSPPFRVASIPETGAPAPIRRPVPRDSSFEGRRRADLPEIGVPGPVFSTPG